MPEGDDERGIEVIASEYLRTLDEAEAKKEELLAQWAEEFYEPGYLDDDEWELLKELIEISDHDHAMMQLEIACYRKAATELGREGEFDSDWPAKGGGRDV